MTPLKRLHWLLATLVLAGCASRPPMPTVDHVDLNRFMGDWYVIASIPTLFEKDSYNAVERYERVGPQKIQTTFTYREGAFDGPLNTMTPVGYVSDSNPAQWGMQFIWPIKADYRIVYLDDQYHTTIIGRRQRDYVWIMAREPTLPEDTYNTLVQVVASLGYDTSKLVKTPQRWGAAP